MEPLGQAIPAAHVRTDRHLTGAAEPVSEEEFLARYDPRAFDLVAVTADLVAVTVNLVTLTVRDGAAVGAGTGTRRSFGRYSVVLELF
jgi:hypothetical protein